MPTKLNVPKVFNLEGLRIQREKNNRGGLNRFGREKKKLRDASKELLLMDKYARGKKIKYMCIEGVK